MFTFVFGGLKSWDYDKRRVKRKSCRLTNQTKSCKRYEQNFVPSLSSLGGSKESGPSIESLIKSFILWFLYGDVARYDCMKTVMYATVPLFSWVWALFKGYTIFLFFTKWFMARKFYLFQDEIALYLTILLIWKMYYCIFQFKLEISKMNNNFCKK